MNMAADEYLLSISSFPVLRFYEWKPKAISLGRFQSATDIDLDYCRSAGIDIVRRQTGGKAVLHDSELTYSFIVDGDLLPRSIVESYQVISSALIHGLFLLGINAEMAVRTIKNRYKSVCFSAPSVYEVVVNGKKLIGSAQRRMSGKILQHGSILIKPDFLELVRCFGLGNDPLAIRDFSETITGIESESLVCLSADEIESAMLKGFCACFGIQDIIPKQFSDADLREIEILAGKYKYSTIK